MKNLLKLGFFTLVILLCPLKESFGTDNLLCKKGYFSKMPTVFSKNGALCGIRAIGLWAIENCKEDKTFDKTGCAKHFNASHVQSKEFKEKLSKACGHEKNLDQKMKNHYESFSMRSATDLVAWMNILVHLSQQKAFQKCEGKESCDCKNTKLLFELTHEEIKIWNTYKHAFPHIEEDSQKKAVEWAEQSGIYKAIPDIETKKMSIIPDFSHFVD